MPMSKSIWLGSLASVFASAPTPRVDALAGEEAPSEYAV
jgi:hypothetical protein